MRKLLILLMFFCNPSWANTPPPLGFVIFCLDYPHECQPKNESEKTDWWLLHDINFLTNQSIKEIADKVGRDIWQIPTTQGDCEDFVLLKRKALIDKGYKWQNLSIAVVRTPYDEIHAVLLAKHDDDVYILDNLHDDILLLQYSDYEIIKRQDFSEKKTWI
jgi:predicted transglutaminase-like cysteine proteinase